MFEQASGGAAEGGVVSREAVACEVGEFGAADGDVLENAEVLAVDRSTAWGDKENWGSGERNTGVGWGSGLYQVIAGPEIGEEVISGSRSRLRSADYSICADF